MTEPSPELQKKSVERIVESLNPPERDQLLKWAEELKSVRDSDLTTLEKAKKTLVITKESKALAPTLKLILKELRRIGWDDRTWIGKLGISGSLIGLLVLNTATGGFAAFGTAIAVPLWLVVGGGGALLGVLIETLQKKRSNNVRNGG